MNAGIRKYLKINKIYINRDQNLLKRSKFEKLKQILLKTEVVFT